jgi:hypothetical protein
MIDHLAILKFVQANMMKLTGKFLQLFIVNVPKTYVI